MTTQLSTGNLNLFDNISMEELDFSKSNLFGDIEEREEDRTVKTMDQETVEEDMVVMNEKTTEHEMNTRNNDTQSNNIQLFVEGFDSEIYKSNGGSSSEPTVSSTQSAGSSTAGFSRSDLSTADSSATLEPPVYQATLSNGRKIPIRRITSKPPISLTDETSSKSNLYGVPIYELLQKLEERREQTLIHEHTTINKTIIKSDILLAEKHRPKRWTDLIGSEKIHRQIMNWLLTWSKVVFDGDLSLQPTDRYGIDELGRPIKKVLLIHGPPGIGKTTVAHIIAKQAGYDILEINASDERSGKIIQNKVQNAIESHRIGKKGPSRPVCIIADEIEGAAENGFIKSLNDLITADQKAVKSRINGGKKNKNSRLLLRPIIAICNDVYASTLRKLRPNAEIIHYPRSDSRMVVSRLKTICEAENIQMNTKQLTELAESSDGDLRMSLNTIQFGSNDSFEKDKSMNWNKISNNMFKQPFTQIKLNNSWQQRINDINTCGEYDKILSGCFVLYPRVRYTDDMLKKPCKMGEWLEFSDQMNSAIYQSQHGALGEYLAYSIASFHQLFSSSNNVKEHRIESEFYQLSENKRSTKELLKDVVSEFQPNIRQMFKINETVLELLPYSIEISSPLIENSSSTLRNSEKTKISNSAETLACLGIQLAKERLESGALVYRFDPPIEQLTVINSQNQDSTAVGKYTVRQLIQDSLMSRIRCLRQKRKESFVQIESKSLKRKKTDSVISINRTSIKDFAKSTTDMTMTTADNEIEIDNERLWIQYVEGFSNAVRKDMTWNDFWVRE